MEKVEKQLEELRSKAGKKGTATKDDVLNELEITREKLKIQLN